MNMKTIEFNLPFIEFLSSNISKDWKVLPLTNVILSISNGTTANQNKNNEGLPVTRIETISEEDINPEKVGYISDISQESVEKYKLNIGDILISHINSEPQLGRSVVYSGEPQILLHGMNLLRIVVNQDLIRPEFLSNVFKFYRANGVFISLCSRAVGQASINQGKMKALPIILPSIPEQDAIVEVLQEIIDNIEVRKKEVVLERERKNSLMELLFSFGIKKEQLQDTDIGKLPIDWAVKTIGIISGVTSGGTPSRDVSAYWNGDIPWVKTGEVNYKLIKDTEEKITQKGLNESSAKIIPAGSILMAMYGQGITRGRVAILGIDAAINQACAAIMLEAKINTYFVYYYLSHIYEKIRNLGHGANQKNLNSALVKSIKVPIPKDYDEQETIGNILRACDDKIITLEKEIELLDELFKTTLDELMTGKLSAMPLIEEENN